MFFRPVKLLSRSKKLVEPSFPDLSLISTMVYCSFFFYFSFYSLSLTSLQQCRIDGASPLLNLHSSTTHTPYNHSYLRMLLCCNTSFSSLFQHNIKPGGGLGGDSLLTLNSRPPLPPQFLWPDLASRVAHYCAGNFPLSLQRMKQGQREGSRGRHAARASGRCTAESNKDPERASPLSTSQPLYVWLLRGAPSDSLTNLTMATQAVQT